MSSLKLTANPVPTAFGEKMSSTAIWSYSPLSSNTVIFSGISKSGGEFLGLTRICNRRISDKRVLSSPLSSLSCSVNVWDPKAPLVRLKASIPSAAMETSSPEGCGTNSRAASVAFSGVTLKERPCQNSKGAPALMLYAKS